MDAVNKRHFVSALAVPLRLRMLLGVTEIYHREMLQALIHELYYANATLSVCWGMTLAEAKSMVRS